MFSCLVLAVDMVTASSASASLALLLMFRFLEWQGSFFEWADPEGWRSVSAVDCLDPPSNDCPVTPPRASSFFNNRNFQSRRQTGGLFWQTCKLSAASNMVNIWMIHQRKTLVFGEELAHYPLSESDLPHQHCFLSKNKLSRQIKKTCKTCNTLKGR